MGQQKHAEICIHAAKSQCSSSACADTATPRAAGRHRDALQDARAAVAIMPTWPKGCLLLSLLPHLPLLLGYFSRLPVPATRLSLRPSRLSVPGCPSRLSNPAVRPRLPVPAIRPGCPSPAARPSCPSPAARPSCPSRLSVPAVRPRLPVPAAWSTMVHKNN